MSNACKALVTITAPPANLTSSTAAPMLPPPTSISTLTIASVPSTLLLEPATAAVIGSSSLSAATSPVDGVSQPKQSNLALTPTTTTQGGVRTAPSTQQHHVTFKPLMSMTKQGRRTASLGSPTTASASEPSLIEPEAIVIQPRVEHQPQHRPLELCHSIQSQVTTIEDVEYDDDVIDIDIDTDSENDDGVAGALPFDEDRVVGVIELEPTPSCNSTSTSSSSSPDK